MNDDEYGTLLLRPLTGEPAGPARLDVARAMRDGGRLRHRRWWSTGTAFAAVAATAVTGGMLATATHDDKRLRLPPDPVFPAACRVEVLPLGHQKSADVTAGDPSGKYLVGTAEPTAGGNLRVMVWRDGKLIAEAATPRLAVIMADINADGVAVGSSASGNPRPYVFRNGKVKVLAGGHGEAKAINDAGTIVGVLNGTRPVRWASPEAQPEPLPLPAGVAEGAVSDIAEDGTIVGTAAASAYLWSADGTGKAIRSPELPGQAAQGFRPAGFRNGWIYGDLQTASDHSPALVGDQPAQYRYEPRTRTWQRLGDSLSAQLVGGSGFLQFGQAWPKVYVGRRILSLPPYAPGTAQGDSFLVTAMSEDARLAAGYSFSGHADPDRPYYPLIWRCGQR